LKYPKKDHETKLKFKTSRIHGSNIQEPNKAVYYKCLNIESALGSHFEVQGCVKNKTIGNNNGYSITV